MKILSQKELSEQAQVIIDEFSKEVNEEEFDGGVESLIKKQLTDDQMERVNCFENWFGDSRIIKPSYDPLKLVCLLEKNTRLNRSVQLRARNTVGLGWEIIDNKLYDELIDEDERPPDFHNKYREEEKRLKRLFYFPNKKQPFSELNYAVKVDEEGSGDGYVEVIRNLGGLITELNHVPGHSVRRLKTGGYIHIRNRKKIYYKEYGDIRLISKKNGRVSGKKLKLEDRAHELLQFSVFSPRDSYYGIPRWIPAVAAICGNRLSAERNIAFFENDAVGRLAVIVNGGKLDEPSIKRIESFLKREGKGTQNAHRILVLQAEAKKTVGVRGENTRIEVVPLTVGKLDDASFQKFRKMNDEEIREALGIGLPFFTSEGVNKASASELKRITIEQEFIPDTIAHEFKWNMTVVKDNDIRNIWTIPPLILYFKRPEQISKIEKSSIIKEYVDSNVLTINEARKELGYKPLPKEFEWGNYPLDFAIMYFQLSLGIKSDIISPNLTTSRVKSVDPNNVKREIQSLKEVISEL